jgi:hypothetical protein
MMNRYVALVAALLFAAPALAQSSDQPAPPQPQARPDPAPPDTGLDSGTSLSNTLSRTGGVITPPDVHDPNVKTPPQAGNTPVIRPPGTPGGNQDVQPK